MRQENKFILDPTCGGRTIWFNKKQPNTIYMDIREGTETINHEVTEGRRNFIISPDIKGDFRNLPFEDKQFKLVVWDPPHLKGLRDTSFWAKKYGSLHNETWRADLGQGFKECLRVLDHYGILIFKWSENDIKLKDILNCFNQNPLFGHTTGSKSKTHWMCFMKIPDQYP